MHQLSNNVDLISLLIAFCSAGSLEKMTFSSIICPFLWARCKVKVGRLWKCNWVRTSINEQTVIYDQRIPNCQIIIILFLLYGRHLDFPLLVHILDWPWDQSISVWPRIAITLNSQKEAIMGKGYFWPSRPILYLSLTPWVNSDRGGGTTRLSVTWCHHCAPVSVDQWGWESALPVFPARNVLANQHPAGLNPLLIS